MLILTFGTFIEKVRANIIVYDTQGVGTISALTLAIYTFSIENRTTAHGARIVPIELEWL